MTNEELEAQCAALRSELEIVRGQLGSMQGMKRSLANELQAAEADAEKAEKEAADLRTKLEKARGLLIWWQEKSTGMPFADTQNFLSELRVKP